MKALYMLRVLHNYNLDQVLTSINNHGFQPLLDAEYETAHVTPVPQPHLLEKFSNGNGKWLY